MIKILKIVLNALQPTSPEVLFSIEEKRKYLVLILSCYIGGTFLLFHGILAYLQGNKLVGIVNLSVFVGLAIFVMVLQKTTKLFLVAVIGTSLMFCHFIFLFINGVVEGSAFVWIYTFPLVSIFLLGLTYGSLFSLALITVVLLGYIFSDYIPYHYPYNPNLIIRLVPSYLVTTLLTIGWEIARKQSEKMLNNTKKEAETANKFKSEFLSNMSHEIRTPLNSIIGFSELMANQELDELSKSYLESIKFSSKNLLQLINDILDLSKIEAGRMKVRNHTISLEEIFKEVRQIFKKQIMDKNLKFNIIIDPLLTFDIISDEIRIRQILLNLVGNAIKFTDRGKIELSAKVISKSKETVDLQITVEDTGIGIQEDEQHKIFESFHQQDGQNTKKYGGTGLGLSISAKLADLLGGEINLVSTPGEGSKFMINLQNLTISKEKSPAQRRDNQNTVRYNFNNQRVLIIDDLEENRYLLESILTTANLQVIKTRDADQAIATVKQQLPEMIITDVKLSRSSGIEIAKYIKNTHRLNKIPIIAITASIDPNLHQLLAPPIFADFLVKPFEPSQLLRIISNFLDHDINLSEPSKPEEKSILTDYDLQLIRDTFPDKITNISDQMVISDILDLAENIISLGEKKKNIQVLRFGKTLKKNSNNFMIDKVNASIKQLSEPEK